MTKLKECPFCGAEAELVEPEPSAHCVECTRCKASSKLVYSLKEDGRPLAAEAWNTRGGKVPEICDHGMEEDEECQACEHDRYSDGETDRSRL